ncbi:MAG: aminopeptidase P family protein [Planctomycetes bacterium]|nr:aminopeptidase P family protein [Planctomycetota bacterium]MBI3836104.1 aminopeptidase P family protein [Planctomycetota bacterium]
MTKSAKGPAPVFSERLRACRRELKACKADAFLLLNDKDYYYLTGFTPDESGVLITQAQVHLLTDTRFTQEIKHDAPWARAWLRKGLLIEEVANACEELGVRRLAVQPDHLTIGQRNEIQKRSKKLRIVSAPPIVSKLRKFKGDADLAAMTKAMRIAEDAFVATRETIRAGQTELEMAARIEYEMKRRGAQSPAFPTICAEGPNAAVPHARPGNRKAKKGSAILFDWGARFAGYCSDLTRVLFVDTIPPKIGEVYRIVLEAQLAGIQAVKPGRRMCDVDAVSRGIIKTAGYGEQFGHGLGHGLGLDVHESPSLSWRSKEELQPGMVVTVEPGIYLPGVGGVRIEDDVLVTERGMKVLSRLDKSLAGTII